MRIAEVIGKVTLSKWYPGFRGPTWLIAVPLRAEGLHGDVSGRGEPLVIYDELGANHGSLVGVTEGAEAAAPFHPNEIPIDAYNAAIFDAVNIEAPTAEAQPQRGRVDAEKGNGPQAGGKPIA